MDIVFIAGTVAVAPLPHAVICWGIGCVTDSESIISMGNGGGLIKSVASVEPVPTKVRLLATGVCFKIDCI